jgi:hypothetical protein
MDTLFFKEGRGRLVLRSRTPISLTDVYTVDILIFSKLLIEHKTCRSGLDANPASEIEAD